VTLRLDDGVVDDAAFQRQRIKIVHLNKNPTCIDPADSSLPAMIRRWASGATFKRRDYFYRMAVRSYCIQHGLLDWPDDQTEDRRRVIASALCASAVVNLANDVEQPYASNKEVAEWAQDKQSRWHGMLVSIRPTLVICGGRAVYAGIERIIQGTPRRMDGWRSMRESASSSALYLEARHPSHWVQPRKFDGELFQRIRLLLESND
jgi:hypothetical protein